MLEFDECDQILVTDPFADDGFTVSSNDNHDAFVTLTLNSSASEHHPLRSPSVSPARRCNTPSIPSIAVIDSEGEMQPRLTSFDGLSTEVAAEEDRTAASEAPRSGGDTIINPVDPNDSFAGVALRYGVSIAALRRANQLWPSDPIHLRTELFIPRGDALRARHKPTRSASTDAALRATVEPTLNLFPNFVASSFVAARNIKFSVLPARISMESLSSKASASEDHELDDFQKARAHKISAAETPFFPSVTAPHAQYKRAGVPLSLQVSYPSSNKHLDDNHIPPADNLHSRSISSSPSISLERMSRAQPFAVPPVRTSQLEPCPRN